LKICTDLKKKGRRILPKGGEEAVEEGGKRLSITIKRGETHKSRIYKTHCTGLGVGVKSTGSA